MKIEIHDCSRNLSRVCNRLWDIRSKGLGILHQGLVLLVLYIVATEALIAETIIDIPPTDTEAFIEAISSANSSEDTWLIRLASKSEYIFNLPIDEPDAIEGHVVVEGNQAQFVGIENTPGFGQLFSVADGGVLELSELAVHSFDSGDDFDAPDLNGLVTIQNGGCLIGEDLRFENLVIDLMNGTSGAVFSNHGELTLDRVRITNITSGPTRAIAIWNGGRAKIRNVLISDAIEVNPDAPDFGGAYIGTHGGILNMGIEYSTFLAKSDLSKSESVIHPIRTEGGIGIRPEATIQGSLFIGLSCPSGPVITSLGFNLHTDMRCAGFFDGDHDLVGVSAQPLLVAYDDGLLVIPQKGSKALDGGNHRASHCPELDAIGTRRPQDGKGNGKARCDIGAFEAREQAPLFDGGENGLYYDAGHDGHFVSVQEVRPNEYVISWNAFDLDGNQSWVIGIGAREGDTITADTWFLPEGRLLPGGSADVDTSALQEWGTISIRLLDCHSGAFTYQSSLPQFGSGSFQLDRLAGIFGLGCRVP